MRTLLCTLICALHIATLTAKGFHLLILADDRDPAIGLAVESDIATVKSSFSRIAKACQVPLHVRLLNSERGRLTQARALNWIDKARIQQDDVVVLYYSGHGDRTKATTTMWPCGGFLDQDVDFAMMIDRLLLKKAHLSLVILDCCNSYSDGTKRRRRPSRCLTNVDDQRLREGCKKLFFNAYGLIITSSSSPGEPSWISTRPDSYFTTALFNNLLTELQTATPEWSSLLEKTKSECFSAIQEHHKRIQNPQYKTFLFNRKKSPKSYRKFLYERCLPEN